MNTKYKALRRGVCDLAWGTCLGLDRGLSASCGTHVVNSRPSMRGLQFHLGLQNPSRRLADLLNVRN